MPKKYKCDLALSAEGETTGYMYLTEEEYNIVKRVVNINNWESLDYEAWCGSLSIYCEELEIGEGDF